MTPDEVRALIAARGETRAEFAAAVGRSRSTVQKWLAGDATPGRRVLRRLAELGPPTFADAPHRPQEAPDAP